MPIKYKGVGGINFTSTYPINIKRKVSSEECAPLKIDYSGKKEAVVEEGTVWEPDYLKFECRGKNAFWMGFLSENGALAETADPDIEYSFDRLNWSRVPTHLADAVEFGDQATNPQHKEVFLRAMMTPGQSVRTTSPLYNASNRYRHFCWRDPAWEVPSEFIYRSGAAVGGNFWTRANTSLSSMVSTGTYQSYFSIYVISKEYCEAHGIDHISIGGTSGNSSTAYKIAVCMKYATQNASGDYVSFSTSYWGNVNGITSMSMPVDFPDGTTHIVVSTITGYLVLHSSSEQEETPNGVIVSGSISSLIDGSGNADWAQSHMLSNSSCLFTRLFSPVFASFNYVNTEPSFSAFIDAYNLKLPYDTNPDDTPICTGNKHQYLYMNLFEDNLYLTRAPKTLPIRILSTSCCRLMFSGCVSLVSAPESLPATISLGSQGYQNMFYNCGSLETPPASIDLIITGNPTTISGGYKAFYEMFLNCTSLKSVPKIKTPLFHWATCAYMFKNCLSLESVPSDFLPETYTTNDECFSNMFNGCSSLKTVPQDLLSRNQATEYGNKLFTSMFENCSSLERCPDIPDKPYHQYATTVTNSGYNFQNMFKGCTSLTDVSNVHIHFNDSPGISCFDGMFDTCTSLTTLPSVEGSKTITSASYAHFLRMFASCSSLTDVSDWKIVITDPTKLYYSAFNSTFYNCTSLLKGPSAFHVNVGNSNTTLVGGDFGSTFTNCSAMTICGEDTDGNRDFYINYEGTLTGYGHFYQTFSGCSSLLKGPSHFHASATNNVNRERFLQGTFDGCSAMTTIGEDHFVIDFPEGISSYMCGYTFRNCSSLTHGPSTLNLLNIDGDQTTASMFLNCTSMTSLGEDSFKLIYTPTVGAQVAYQMFNSCTSLVHGPSTLEIHGAIRDYSYASMFGNCSSMTSLGEDSFIIDIPNATQSALNGAFKNCISLLHGPRTFKIGTIDTNALIDTFNNCTSMLSMGEDVFTIESVGVGQNGLRSTFYGCKSLVSAPTVFKLSGSLASGACQETFGGPSGPDYPLGCNVMDLDFANVDFSGVTYFASSACQAMFNGCLKAHGACPAFPPSATFTHNCFRQMYADCANMEGLPDIPYEDLTTASSVFMQTFWNVGNPTHGGTRPTSCNCHFKSGTGANATQAMFAHIGGVQFHVPAGNPYGWSADSTATAPPHKHLHESFTIIDDL